MRKRRNEEGKGGDDGRKRRWRSTAQLYERAASERQRASQQRQRADRSVSVHIARKIGTFVESEMHQAALCHGFNVRVSRREVSFEEWGDFVRELYRKFSRFIGLRYNPIMLHQVENLIILGRLTYGDERIRPVLSQLGVFLNLYLDENGRHNIVQLRTQLSEGPLPADDPVFHYLPYRHGSLEDIAQRVESIPIENAADDGICPICYNDFADSSSSDSSHPMKLPACTHVYHSACITPWLAQNPTCPVCRRKAFSDL